MVPQNIRSFAGVAQEFEPGAVVEDRYGVEKTLPQLYALFTRVALR